MQTDRRLMYLKDFIEYFVRILQVNADEAVHDEINKLVRELRSISDVHAQDERAQQLTPEEVATKLNNLVPIIQQLIQLNAIVPEGNFSLNDICEGISNPATEAGRLVQGVKDELCHFDPYDLVYPLRNIIIVTIGSYYQNRIVDQSSAKFKEILTTQNVDSALIIYEDFLKINDSLRKKGYSDNVAILISQVADVLAESISQDIFHYYQLRMFAWHLEQKLIELDGKIQELNKQCEKLERVLNSLCRSRDKIIEAIFFEKDKEKSDLLENQFISVSQTIVILEAQLGLLMSPGKELKKQSDRYLGMKLYLENSILGAAKEKIIENASNKHTPEDKLMGNLVRRIPLELIPQHVDQLIPEPEKALFNKKFYYYQVRNAYEIHRHQMKLKLPDAVDENTAHAVSNNIFEQFIKNIKNLIESTPLLAEGNVKIGWKKINNKKYPTDLAKIYQHCLIAEKDKNWEQHFHAMALIGSKASLDKPFTFFGLMKLSHAEAARQRFYENFKKAISQQQNMLQRIKSK